MKKKKKKVMHIENLNLSIFQSLVYNIPFAKSVKKHLKSIIILKILSHNNKSFQNMNQRKNPTTLQIQMAISSTPRYLFESASDF